MVLTGPRAAWDAVVAEVTLPCFDAWHFHTIDEDDDFQAIAGRLAPFERSRKHRPRRGRLRPRGDHADCRSPQPRFVSMALSASCRSRAIRRSRASRTMWPTSRKTWPSSTSWPGAGFSACHATTNLGPRPALRFRTPAGAGNCVSIRVREARQGSGHGRRSPGRTGSAMARRARPARWRCWPSVYATSRFGLRGTRSQWKRRLPLDPVTALTVVAPMLARIPSGGATVADFLVGRTSRLVSRAVQQCGTAHAAPAHRASAHRRAGRDIAGRAVRRRRDALRASARAPSRPEGPARLWWLIPKTEDGRGIGLPRKAPCLSRPRWPQCPKEPSKRSEVSRRLFDEQAEFLVGNFFVPNIRTTAFRSPTSAWSRASVLDGISPMVDRPPVVAHVLDRFTGVRQPELAAPDLALELDIPLWSFLKEAAPDWLLPGCRRCPGGQAACPSDQPGLRRRAAGRR